MNASGLKALETLISMRLIIKVEHSVGGRGELEGNGFELFEFKAAAQSLTLLALSIP